MKLKHLFAVAIIALLHTSTVVAQNREKVVERNPRKMPEWVYSTGGGQFVSTKRAATIDEAREMCLADIKAQIISAVAENIQAEISFETRERTLEDGTMAYSDDFKQELASSSVVLPFVSGISLSKATGFYYEKIQNKDTKEYSYNYSVLYPFSDAELYMLISDFNDLDRSKVAILNSRTEELATSEITSTNQIEAAVKELESLLNYFFDTERKERTEALIESYEELYSRISIGLVESSAGEFSYNLLLDGNVITTPLKPRITSNCALAIAVKTGGGATINVSYDNEGCIDDEANYFDISYLFPNSPLRERIFPVMTDQKIEVETYSTMVVSYDSLNSEGYAEGITIAFELKSANDDVIVTGVNVSIPEIQGKLNFSELSTKLSAGINTVELCAKEPMRLVPLGTKLPFTKGAITLQSISGGVTQTIPCIVKYSIAN